MLKRLKFLVPGLFGALALVAVACGGGDDDGGDGEPPQRETGGDGASNGSFSDEEFVSAGALVLSKSVQSYTAEEITSMSGAITFDFSMGTTSVNGSADFAFEDDAMHMALSFEGGDQASVVDLSQLGTFEVLVRDDEFFINIPFLGGWFTITDEDMPESSVSISDMLSRGSPFDFSGLAGALGGGVEYIGEDEIDGRATVHYQLTGDLQSLIGSFSDALAATGDNAFSDQILGSEITGPVTIDVWVGKGDFLPYKLTGEATIDTGETGVLTLDLVATFGDYNGDVDIPDAPDDAQSLGDLFGQMGFDPSAGIPSTP